MLIVAGTKVRSLADGKEGVLKKGISVDDPSHFFSAEGIEMEVAKVDNEKMSESDMQRVLAMIVKAKQAVVVHENALNDMEGALDKLWRNIKARNADAADANARELSSAWTKANQASGDYHMDMSAFTHWTFGNL